MKSADQLEREAALDVLIKAEKTAYEKYSEEALKLAAFRPKTAVDVAGNKTSSDASNAEHDRLEDSFAEASAAYTTASEAVRTAARNLNQGPKPARYRLPKFTFSR